MGKGASSHVNQQAASRRILFYRRSVRTNAGIASDITIRLSAVALIPSRSGLAGIKNVCVYIFLNGKRMCVWMCVCVREWGKRGVKS